MLDVELGDKVDVVFTLSINEYNGSLNLQIVIKDISPYGDFAQSYDAFEKVCSSGKIDDPSDVPEFHEFETVYRVIAKIGAIATRPYELLEEVNKRGLSEITMLKFLIILAVFSELSLLDFSVENNVMSVSIIRDAEKTSLDKSELLRRLKNND